MELYTILNALLTEKGTVKKKFRNAEIEKSKVETEKWKV